MEQQFFQMTLVSLSHRVWKWTPHQQLVNLLPLLLLLQRPSNASHHRAQQLLQRLLHQPQSLSLSLRTSSRSCLGVCLSIIACTTHLY